MKQVDVYNRLTRETGLIAMHVTSLKQYHPTVDETVEYLCEQGCMKVSTYIEALQADQYVPGLEMLGRDERQAVLEELESIMSVYQGTCTT